MAQPPLVREDTPYILKNPMFFALESADVHIWRTSLVRKMPALDNLPTGLDNLPNCGLRTTSLTEQDWTTSLTADVLYRRYLMNIIERPCKRTFILSKVGFYWTEWEIWILFNLNGLFTHKLKKNYCKIL